MKTQLDTMRQQLIEVATQHPYDIENFYKENLIHVNGCSFLNKDAPDMVSFTYRGKSKQYRASLVPFVLAGVDPYGRKSCGIHGCINPNHVL